MKKTYVVADTHFRSDLYREWFINTWNTKVRKCDLVIHLGDVAFNEEGLRTLSFLNGRKILVLGNHDTLPMQSYKQYFAEVYQYYRYKDILLSHAPVTAAHPWLSPWRMHEVGIKKLDSWTFHEKQLIYCGASFPNVSIKGIIGNVHGHFHGYGKSWFQSPWANAQAPHYKTPYSLFTVHDTPIDIKTIIKRIKRERKKLDICP